MFDMYPLYRTKPIKLMLKKMLRRCFEINEKFMTIENCIIPVGGYENTAALAVNTYRNLLGRSKVFAVLDADAFDEGLSSNENFNRLYQEHHSMIMNLYCTPEVWMVEKIENMSNDVVYDIINEFNCEVSQLINSSEYRECNSTNIRKLAKQKMKVVINQLSLISGESKDIVLDKLVQILIDREYTDAKIQQTTSPMLNSI